MTDVRPSSELLGREPELAAIAQLVRMAGEGEGSVLVIEGPAGIGKTSLIAEARQVARDAGMRVVSARGGELEQEFAFGIVRQLFEPALARASQQEHETWLAGAAGYAAPVFEAEIQGPPVSDPGFQRRHGLYWLAANLATSSSHGLLLLIDDAQWADAASIEFLSFIARRLVELPLGLIVAGRPVDLGFGGLAVDPAAQVLRPAPLDSEQVAMVVTEVLDRDCDPAFCEACRHATGGVPFLLRELLREITAEGIVPLDENASRVASLSPRNVSTAVSLRLAGLPHAAAALAQAVAVLGDGGSPKVAAELAGISEDEAAAMSQMLVDAEVIAADGSLHFVHPIVRTAIYDGMPAVERPRAHARAAAALRVAGATDEVVAAQLQLAAPLGERWAVEVLRNAAARARALGAPGVAAGYLRRALAEVHDDAEREELLVQLALADSDAGSVDAEQYLAEAATLALSPHRRAEIAVQRARMLRFVGRGVEALDVVDEADAELAGADPDLSDRLELERLGAATMSTEALRRLIPLRERLPDPGRPPESDSERFRLGLLALDQAQCGTSADTVIELASRAVAGRFAGQPPTQISIQAIAMAAIALSLADRCDQALALTNELVDLTERAAVLGGAAAMLAQRAQIHHRRGSLAEAKADASRALSIGIEIRAAAALHTRAGGILARVAVQQGDTPDPDLMAAATATESTATRSLAYSHGEHLLAQGQFAAAATSLLEFGEFECGLGWIGPTQFSWRSDAALALDQLGESERARSLVTEELELARDYGAPRPIGIALRVLGRVTRGPERLALLEESVALLSASGSRLEQARALVEFGTALRLSGRRAAAREQLQSGYELATRCAATRLAERAWQEQLAAGARPRRRELTGVASLTPSERRIVELAVKGQTNREIAQALFVTAKTVETHLGHAYDKLGISSRVELEAALSGGPPT